MPANAELNPPPTVGKTESSLLDILVLFSSVESRSELIGLVHAVVGHPEVEQLVASACGDWWRDHHSRSCTELDLLQQTYLGLIRQLLKRRIALRRLGNTEFQCLLEKVIQRAVRRAWRECHSRKASAVAAKMRLEDVDSKSEIHKSEPLLTVDLADCIAHIPNEAARQALEERLLNLTIGEAASIHHWSRRKVCELRKTGLSWLKAEWCGPG